MDFEAMKIIWDSQNKEPLYAMNEAALHTIVRRRNYDVHQRAARCQIPEIVGGIAFGVLIFAIAGILALGDPASIPFLKPTRVPVAPWHVAALLVAGGIFFYYAAYMYGARRRQLRREEHYATSLRGDLDRAVDHVDFQIRISRSIVWWGLIPQWVGAGLWIAVIFDLVGASAKHYALIAPIMVVALAAVVACQHRAISRRYEPRRRELESLRDKLANPNF